MIIYYYIITILNDYFFYIFFYVKFYVKNSYPVLLLYNFVFLHIDMTL